MTAAGVYVVRCGGDLSFLTGAVSPPQFLKFGRNQLCGWRPERDDGALSLLRLAGL